MTREVGLEVDVREVTSRRNNLYVLIAGRGDSPALMVVDEIGYLPVRQEGAILFFQLIKARHELASPVLTSNKGFEDWGKVLPQKSAIFD